MAKNDKLVIIITEIREKYPDIQPYKEDDWEWYTEGMKLLRRDNYSEAEDKFQKLILSQPKHPDGFKGLSLVYEQIDKKEEGIVLIEEAIRLANAFLKEGTLDQEIIDEMLEVKERLEKN